MGTIVLMGGNEFRADCRAMDETLLAFLSRKPPRVVIIPTAAAHENPRLAAQNGLRYFASLGAQASGVMVTTRTEAEDPAYAQQCADADVIYLAGGSPTYLLETLRDSLVWMAIQQRYQSGAMIIGSSAGAMVLGEQMRGHQGLVEGLGLAPHVMVWPHHRPSIQETTPAWGGEWDPQLAMVGIAEATACHSSDEHRWHVIGAGTVAIYTASQQRIYRPGEAFDLP